MMMMMIIIIMRRGDNHGSSYALAPTLSAQWDHPMCDFLGFVLSGDADGDGRDGEKSMINLIVPLVVAHVGLKCPPPL